MSGRGGGRRGNESMAPTQQATPSPSSPVSGLSSEHEHGLTLQTQQPTVTRASQPKPEAMNQWRQRGNESMAPTQKATPSPSSPVSGLSSEHEHGLTLQTRQPTVTRASQLKMKATAMNQWRQRGDESVAPTQQAPPGRGRGSHHALSTPSPSDPVSGLSSEFEHGLTLQTQQLTVTRASQPTMAVQQQKPAASSKAVKFPQRPGYPHHYNISINSEVISRTEFDAYDGREGFYIAGALPFTSEDDFLGSTMIQQPSRGSHDARSTPSPSAPVSRLSSEPMDPSLLVELSDRDLHHYDRPGHIGTGRSSHDSRSSLSALVSRLSSELEHGLTLQTQQPTVARAFQPKPEMKTMAVQQQKLAASSKAMKLPVGTGFSDQDLHHYDISITPEVISRRHKVVMAEILDKHGKTEFDGRKPAYDGRKGFYTAGALPFTSKDFLGSTIKQKLPMDLADEILCRLPVKSVLRFRCLSREFCSVIDGPTFIKRHQIRSTNSNKSLVVSGISGICSVDFDLIDTTAVHLPLPSESWFFRTSIVGSCNGLLALYNSKLGIALLNIATRKHLILPQFWSEFDSFSKFYDGFCYDSANDAYKLVRIVSSSESLTEVTVYNLRDNTWRKIDDDFPYFLEVSHGVGTFVCGALNWIVGGIDSDFEYDNLILSFDIQKETFSQVPKPHITDRSYDICIGDLGGSLYLSCNKEYEHAFDIWVMNEYGVEKSWGKLFSFSFERPLDTFAVSPMIRALAYTKRGDKVLLYRDDRSVFWYDLGEGRLERVGFKGWPSYISKVIVYEGSLVSPFYTDS